MDFVTHFPGTAASLDCIKTCVDRFSRRVHLISSKYFDTAEDVARFFHREIFLFHGLPDSAGSDRDSRAMAGFGKQQMKCCGI